MYGIASYGTRPYGTVYLDEQESATPALANSVSLSGSVTTQVDTTAVIVPISTQILQGNITSSVSDSASIVPISAKIFDGSISGAGVTDSASIVPISVLIKQSRPAILARITEMSTNPLTANLITETTAGATLADINTLPLASSISGTSGSETANLGQINMKSLLASESTYVAADTAVIVPVTTNTLTGSETTSVTDQASLEKIVSQVTQGSLTTSSGTQANLVPIGVITQQTSDITSSIDSASLAFMTIVPEEGDIALPAIGETAELVSVNTSPLDGFIGTSVRDNANIVPITVKTNESRFIYQARIACFGEGANNISLTKTNNTYIIITEENKLGCDT